MNVFSFTIYLGWKLYEIRIAIFALFSKYKVSTFTTAVTIVSKEQISSTQAYVISGINFELTVIITCFGVVCTHTFSQNGLERSCTWRGVIWCNNIQMVQYVKRRWRGTSSHISRVVNMFYLTSLQLNGKHCLVFCLSTFHLMEFT